jgi:Fe-S cluster assembly protein SufD
MESTTTISAKEKFLMLVDQGSQGISNDSAREALNTLELPTTRQEDWRYTRVGKIASEDWKWSTSNHPFDIRPFQINGLNAHHIVFVHGKYRADLSDQAELTGITFRVSQESSAPVNGYRHFFEALSYALTTTHIKLDVAAKTNVGRIIHIIHATTEPNVISQPMITIACGESSAVHIIESFVSAQEIPAFTNRTLKIQIGKNARLNLDKIQQESDAHFLMNDERIQIDTDGRYTENTLTTDGGWIRNNTHVSMHGKNAEANLHGIYLPRRKQHIDNHTLIDHRVPHCNSNELYKGLLNNYATGVFNGKVYVQPDAQKTNAFQSNANILLSSDAQINTKPELEIYADDVKCSHGSTTGQIDENALFYLKARGLGDETARRLLNSAFISDVLNKVENEFVRQYVIDDLVKKELLIG